MSIEKITSAIIDEAQAECEQILNAAETKNRGVIAQLEKRIKIETDVAVREAGEERERIISRRKSVADIDGKKIVLAKKQQLIDGCFEEAVEHIVSMDEDQYVEFLAAAGKNTGFSQGSLIFNEKEKTSIGRRVVEALNKAVPDGDFHLAEETENLFLINYVRLLIDILNVITFVRLRQMKKPWTFFSKIFLQGGQMAESLFVGGYEENYHKLADRFRPYGFAEIIEKGGEKVRETGMYSLLEKLCDNKRIEYIKDAKYISFGIEPAAAYLIAKDSEIKNLRMIFTGKIAGTPKEVILERLRKTYV